MNIERRYIEEIRADIEARTIEGKAICFNSESRNLGGFTEIILPEAVDETLIRNSNIVFLYNHDEDLGVLARSKKGVGTLDIEIREDGVYFRFEAPNTSLGNDVLESVKRGDLDACSFAFRISKENQKLEKRDNGIYLRTISKFDELRDFSVVVNPAYEETEASVRNVTEQIEEIEAEEIRMAKEAEEKAEQEAKEAKEKAEQEAREAEIAREKEVEAYYEALDKQINDLKK